jgi:hypothetical protein
MAFSQTDLDAIESAIALGELTVEIDGKRVTYRSIDELVKARSIITSALQESGTIPKKTRATYVARSRD